MADSFDPRARQACRLKGGNKNSQNVTCKTRKKLKKPTNTRRKLIWFVRKTEFARDTYDYNITTPVLPQSLCNVVIDLSIFIDNYHMIIMIITEL